MGYTLDDLNRYISCGNHRSGTFKAPAQHQNNDP